MEIQLWRSILCPYELAVKELVLKFEHIITEHRENDLYSPIEQVSGRVKSVSSILEKMQRKHIPMERMEEEVEDIALRHTVVKTFENTRVIIPNSTMNSTVLENISLTNEQKANFLELDISYESDVDRAMSIISEEAAKHPNFLDIRTPNEIENGVPAVVVRITGFLDNSVHLRATLYSKNNSEGFAMLCDLRYTIKKRFDEENIEFPYPHRTIILKNETKQEETSA